jgi:hypothetical protein
VKIVEKKSRQINMLKKILAARVEGFCGILSGCDHANGWMN